MSCPHSLDPKGQCHDNYTKTLLSEHKNTEHFRLYPGHSDLKVLGGTGSAVGWGDSEIHKLNSLQASLLSVIPETTGRNVYPSAPLPSSQWGVSWRKNWPKTPCLELHVPKACSGSLGSNESQSSQARLAGACRISSCLWLNFRCSSICPHLCLFCYLSDLGLTSNLYFPFWLLYPQIFMTNILQQWWLSPSDRFIFFLIKFGANLSSDEISVDLCLQKPAGVAGQVACWVGLCYQRIKRIQGLRRVEKTWKEANKMIV